MCIKPRIQAAPFRLITANINDYVGNHNDLNGCLNDGRQAKETVLTHWPEADIIRMTDSAATVGNFSRNVSQSIAVLPPDSTVAIFSDSCFSGDNTKFMHIDLTGSHPTRNRFQKTLPGPIRPSVKMGTTRAGINWIAFSGCGETQYSADAWINSEYHGAFSWYLFNLLEPGITYFEWYLRVRKYLPSSQFEQAPTIDGPGRLLDRKVGVGPTLWIHNSTHGTQIAGDSEEQVREAICFYDGNLSDKAYGAMLSKIKIAA